MQLLAQELTLHPAPSGKNRNSPVEVTFKGFIECAGLAASNGRFLTKASNSVRLSLKAASRAVPLACFPALLNI